MGKKSQSKTLPGKLEKMQKCYWKITSQQRVRLKLYMQLNRNEDPQHEQKIIIFYLIYFKWNPQRWSVCEPEDQSIITGTNKQSEKSLVNTGVKLTSYSGEFKTCNSKMCTSILWSSGKEIYVTTEDHRSVVGYTRIQILLLIRIHWSNYINNKIRAFFFYMYWWMFEYVFWLFVF